LFGSAIKKIDYDSETLAFLVLALMVSAFVLSIVALVQAKTNQPVYIATNTTTFNLPSNAANNTVMISAPVEEITPINT
jgi:hypothetical protein